MCSNRTAAAQPSFVQLHREDLAAQRAELAAGLLRRPPAIAPKFLYDALGSRLFEAITELDEYYPTRTEAAIFERHREDMAQSCGRGHTLVDLGAGNCAKAARLFDTLQPRSYVAVDISVDFLRHALNDLQRSFPQLPMLGVGLDFSQRLELPTQVDAAARLMFYPGSSIGNFAPDSAAEFLRSVRAASPGGALLIGVDLVKPKPLLDRAYDDPLGVTSAFNLNLLRNVNRVLGTDFDVAQWQHVAFFDEAQSRIEMHLQARSALSVRWAGAEWHVQAGQRLHTENSYKYTLEGFDALLRQAGYVQTRFWTDVQGWFAVFLAR
jgi:L-histidine N-alpha-methyltransferase